MADETIDIEELVSLQEVADAITSLMDILERYITIHQKITNNGENYD